MVTGADVGGEKVLYPWIAIAADRTLAVRFSSADKSGAAGILCRELSPRPAANVFVFDSTGRTGLWRSARK